MKEVRELGHNKEEVEELYGQAVKVKGTMKGVERVVDRLEGKRREHARSAGVVQGVTGLEEGQEWIIRSTKENKQLLEYMQTGMQENL